MIHTGIIIVIFFSQKNLLSAKQNQRTPGSTRNTFTNCTILNKSPAFSALRSTELRAATLVSGSKR